MEKVVVFGATGQTGESSIVAALQKGISVRAFVRNLAKLRKDLRARVEIVQGDVLKYEDVLAAVENATGVVIALGTGTNVDPTTVISEGTRNIIRAMEALNVEVVSVCSSAFLFYEAGTAPELYKNITADHARQWELLEASKLKYIAVLPRRMKDVEGATTYKVTQDCMPDKEDVSMLHLGNFLIESLTLPQYYRKKWGICSQ